MGVKVTLGFLGGSVVKNPPASAGDAGDLGSIPGSGRSPGEGNGNPLQYSCLGNPMDRGAWGATVHGVAKSRTQLSNWAQHTAGSVFKDSELGLSGGWWQSLEGEEGGCTLTSTASALFEFVPLKLSAWDCFSSWEEERERGLRRNGLMTAVLRWTHVSFSRTLAFIRWVNGWPF